MDSLWLYVLITKGWLGPLIGCGAGAGLVYTLQKSGLTSHGDVRYGHRFDHVGG